MDGWTDGVIQIYPPPSISGGGVGHTKEIDFITVLLAKITSLLLGKHANFVLFCTDRLWNKYGHKSHPTPSGWEDYLNPPPPLTDDLHVLVKKMNTMWKHPRGCILWILANSWLSGPTKVPRKVWCFHPVCLHCFQAAWTEELKCL